MSDNWVLRSSKVLQPLNTIKGLFSKSNPNNNLKIFIQSSQNIKEKNRNGQTDTKKFSNKKNPIKCFFWFNFNSNESVAFALLHQA